MDCGGLLDSNVKASTMADGCPLQFSANNIFANEEVQEKLRALIATIYNITTNMVRSALLREASIRNVGNAPCGCPGSKRRFCSVENQHPYFSTTSPSPGPSMHGVTQVVSRANSRFTSDEDFIYHHCLQGMANGNDRVVVEIDGHTLRLSDLYTMRPCGWVSGQVINFAGWMVVQKQLSKQDKVRLHVFDMIFGTRVVQDIGGDSYVKYRRWDLNAYKPQCDTLSYDICSCDLWFVPILFEKHWFLYVLNLHDRRVDILDSMENGRGDGHTMLDNRMKELLQVVLNYASTRPIDIGGFPIVKQPIPQQHNTFDCGIHVMMAIEQWDGHIMPIVDEDAGNLYRKQMVINWVFHSSNKKLVQMKGIAIKNRLRSDDLHVVPVIVNLSITFREVINNFSLSYPLLLLNLSNH